MADVATPFSAWLALTGSYLALMVCEPIVTWVVVNGLKKLEDRRLISRLFIVNNLQLAK